MLIIKDFGKRYKGNKIGVENVNIHVNAGDIYGFIGPNGAGKTTTLKSIAGLLSFEQGDIFVNGNSVTEKPLLVKKDIAYIPDNPDIYEALTGIQYLNFIADVFEVTAEDRNLMIHEYATLFGIFDDLGSQINSYSHGMKQKLVIISALIHKPKLMLLDEPFVGLDPQATFHLREIMKKMCAEGSAIFFSTHVLEVAEKLCNKVAIIRKGQIVVSGDVKEVTKNANLEQIFMELVEA